MNGRYMFLWPIFSFALAEQEDGGRKPELPLAQGSLHAVVGRDHV